MIKKIFCDVDGTLTDGKIYYDKNGNASHAFSSLDGHAVPLARNNGINVCFITGQSKKNGQSIIQRAEDLDVTLFFSTNKKAEIKDHLYSIGVDPSEAVMVGNDEPDIEAGLYLSEFFVPENAHFRAQQQADIVIPKRGGEGVLRDVVDILLMRKEIDIG